MKRRFSLFALLLALLEHDWTLLLPGLFPLLTLPFFETAFGTAFPYVLLAKAAEAKAKFDKAMDDDLNTPDALAAVFDLVKEINTLSAASSKAALEAAAKAFDEITGVLGLMYNRKKDEVPAEVTELVEKRAAAKKAKDWAAADAIRAQLTEMGWAVKDTAQGPQLSKI